jgi:hypothetical protein
VRTDVDGTVGPVAPGRPARAVAAPPLRFVPGTVIAMIVVAMLIHGPIAQPARYHDFADVSEWLGIEHAADVLSNLPFAIVGMWALLRRRAGAAWTAFDAALVLTAIGSGYYHASPDDARLAWDRLPIALACAALLAAVHSEMRDRAAVPMLAALCAAGVATVVWWRVTGDLRPYLLLQGAPLLLVPFWQWQGGARPRARIMFGIAIAGYVAAKACEVFDHEILEAVAVVSGHTLKHLLAAAAALMIVEGRGAPGRVG